MDDIRQLSWEIYEALKANGVEVGNASVAIIKKAIESHLASAQIIVADQPQSDNKYDDMADG